MLIASSADFPIDDCSSPKINKEARKIDPLIDLRPNSGNVNKMTVFYRTLSKFGDVGYALSAFPDVIDFFSNSLHLFLLKYEFFLVSKIQ